MNIHYSIFNAFNIILLQIHIYCFLCTFLSLHQILGLLHIPLRRDALGHAFYLQHYMQLESIPLCLNNKNTYVKVRISLVR